MTVSNNSSSQWVNNYKKSCDDFNVDSHCCRTGNSAHLWTSRDAIWTKCVQVFVLKYNRITLWLGLYVIWYGVICSILCDMGWGYMLSIAVYLLYI